MSERRAFAWVLVSLLLQAMLLAIVVAGATGIFEARERHDRARITNLEAQVATLCAQKSVTDVRIVGASLKVSRSNGC